MFHPTAVIAKGAEIHPDAAIGPYCVLGEHVRIGADTELVSHVVVSGHTEIGERNRIFPFAAIGNEPLILANCATLAGHIEIADGVIVGGLSAIHQFVRVGRYVMIGGMCGINKDVPPFCLVSGGYRAELSGLNLVGLKRRGFSLQDVKLLKQLYRILLQSNESLADRIEQAQPVAGENSHAREMLEFIGSAQRGLVVHKRDGG